MKELLTRSDVAKVYWAQWVDNDLGMLTSDLHRKAIFNAYKLYQTLLPVDRNVVQPDGTDGVGILAASDDHTAGVVLWNENSEDRTVTVRMHALPFAHGSGALYRIDATHASYIDSPSAEALRVDDRWRIAGASTRWTGVVPAESVVFLRAADGSGRSLLTPNRIGEYVRSLYALADHTATAYADFDPRTAIARVGMGDRNRGLATIGAVLDRPTPRWQVHVTKSGPFKPASPEALFGLRIDFGANNGGYSRSVLYHDGSLRPGHGVTQPWSKAVLPADQIRSMAAMRTGKPFLLDIARLAPADWNHRIVVTPILRDMGAGSSARILLSPVMPASH